jgi:hypothetical protein
MRKRQLEEVLDSENEKNTLLHRLERCADAHSLPVEKQRELDA